jgi:pimeloyl-ACP methyl ester carboxylesterase
MSVHSPFSELLDEVPGTKHTISVLGSSTAYWAYGPEDAAVTLVIAHGYRGEHHGLEPVIAQLRDVRVIGPDMPGFGESTPLTEVAHDIPGYAAWLGAFIESLGLSDTAVIVGHSFGSIIGSYGVAKGILTPPKLILINPIAQPGLEGPNRFLTQLTVVFYAMSLKLPERLANWMLRHWIVVQMVSSSMVTTKDKQLRRWIHDQHHTYFGNFSDRATVVEAFNASISLDVSSFGAQIQVPTLLIGAEFDPITPVEALHTLQQQMPDAQLHVIPGVGHLIHYEKPLVTAKLIVDFLGVGRVARP